MRPGQRRGAAWDLATAYAGAMAILAAERHRRLTGQGQRIVLPLQDMALAATSALGYIGEAVVNEVDRPRFGNEIFGTFGRDFRTKDGRFVMICIFSDRHVDALAEAGGFAEAFARSRTTEGVDLKTDAGRWNARAELCAVIEPWVAAHTAAEVERGAEEGRRAVGALPDLPRAAPRQGRRARQPDVHRARPARHRPLSGGRHAVAVRRLRRASRRSPRRCSASIRTKSCRLSSACRRTRSPGCMTRRWSVAQDDRILIAGGGIGGLAAALALAQKNIASLVLEKAASSARSAPASSSAPTPSTASIASASARPRAQHGGLYRPAPADGRAWPTARSPISISARPSARASAIPMPSSIAATCMACC